MSETSSPDPVTNEGKNGMPIWIQGLGIFFTASAIVYATHYRTFEDYIKYGSYIVSGLLAVLIIILGISFVGSGIKKSDIKTLVIASPIAILVVLFMGVSYYSMFALLKDIFLWIKSPTLSKTSTVVLSSLLVLTLGSALFYFRLRMRAIYGITEAAIGIVVAGNRALAQTDQFLTSDFYLAILTASIFLIVRGFDNIHQGLTKDPIDRYGTKLLRFLKTRI